MEYSFIAWVFLMSFALVGPGLLFLLLALAKGLITDSEEGRMLPIRGQEGDYWQETWSGGEK